MKKHLIAAAVAAAVAVPAAAQVTVSGVIDVSALSNSKVETQATPAAAVVTNPKSQSTAGNNGWSTSQLLFSGTEDLGGGLRASFALAAGLTDNNAFADRDRFIALQGGFGTVRLGDFVPAASMGFFGYTQAGTNGVAGNIYGIGNNNTTAGNANNVNNFGGYVGGSFERNANNVQFTTPTFNGITVNVNYGSSTTDSDALAGETDATQQGLHVGYVAGPLSVGIATSQRTVGVEATNGTAGVAIPGAVPAAAAQVGVLGAVAVTQSEVKSNLEWIGASYNFGAATVGLAHVTRDGKTTANTGISTNNDKISVMSFGATVPMGAFTLRATMHDGDNARTDVATDDVELSGHQFSVTYALSKRTLAYFAVGESKAERTGGNVTAGANKTTGSALGFAHSF